MDVRFLKGVGESRAQLLRKLGIYTAEGLLRHYPRAYEDRSALCALADIRRGEACCFRAVVGAPVTHTRAAGNLQICKTQAYDGSGSATLTFFNAPYVKNALKPGSEYVFYGKAAHSFLSQPEFINPVFEPVSAAGRSTGRILPLYRLTAGLSQGFMRSCASCALDKALGGMREGIPDRLRGEAGLCGLAFALRNIHFPESEDARLCAKRRLVYEELLVLGLALALLRASRGKTPGRRYAPAPLGDFRAKLPFALTPGQEEAIAAALGDMASGALMHRLVQGDVGSGKTAVAAACALSVIRAKAQCALMAPTEILAEQHFRTLAPLMESLGARAALLTGSLSATRKKKAREAAAAGEIDLLIGTHALLSAGVRFREPGLVITDEQHRFGVRQQALLGGEGGGLPPHRLVMSATPIPRTLGLTLYGDMDVTVMRGLPPGRRPVKTYVVTEEYRPRIHAFIRKLAEKGLQTY
ncbi:MAG: DEAD/DEAH box helicase, partial [Oscillospiraceae bacterium]|nr:DEAD/DEAH box helicase [Oscillospiraceae bacterium]